MSGDTDTETDSESGQQQTGDSDSGADNGPPDSTRYQRYAVIVLAAVTALVISAVLGTAVYGYTNSMASGEETADGTIAVLEYDGPIVTGSGAQVESQLRDIRQNESIEGVVLNINTGGGLPAPSERMYLAIQRTAEQMPVIASVQTVSASGGYYAMAPADDIYVLPTSTVGSVGVAAGAPQPTGPVRGPTGPDKRGANVIQSWARVETLRSTFLQTVVEQRGDQIEMPPEEISKASVFSGVTAVENGFADEIGSLDDAIADVANRAGLESYDVAHREASVNAFPVLLSTGEGMVVVHDENPSYGDVTPVNYAYVYEPRVPDIETVDAVARPQVEALIEALRDDGNETGGEQP